MALEPVDEWLLGDQPDMLWELYHANSKVGRHDRHPLFALRPSDATVVGMMRQLRTVKPYRDRPKVALPTELPAAPGFDEVVRARETARGFAGTPITLAALAKVLTFGYGVQRDETAAGYPRPFRAVPSGGALYPLELYVHATRVDGLEPGLHHYDPEDAELDVLRPGDEVDRLATLVIQPELVRDAAAVVLVTATFLRSVFKYGERGYRFVLLEAGHLAQNVVLTATSLGLAAAPVGGYLDADVDRYLGFDGVRESTVYVILLGQPDT